MTTQPMTERITADLLWPAYATPGDLALIESVPLRDRGLPESTYALLARAATLWPHRVAVSVLPDAEPTSDASDASNSLRVTMSAPSRPVCG